MKTGLRRIVEMYRQGAGGRLEHCCIQVALLMMALAGLYGISAQLHGLAYWPVFGMLVLVSLPMFFALSEGVLFKRQAMLDRAAQPHGWLKRWFWAGNLALAMQVCRAFVLAALLLCVSTLLSTLQWYVVVIDGVLLLLLFHACCRQFSGQVKTDYLAVFVRNWPLFWLNTALLALAFFFLDYCYGTVDTRSISWDALQEETRETMASGAATAWIGWLSGWLAVIDQSVWHFSQKLIPTIESTTVKIMVWLLVLLPAGIIAYTLNYFLLGVLSIADHVARRQPTESLTRSLLKKFLVVSVALAVLYWQLPKVAIKPVIAQASGIFNPCEVDEGRLASLHLEVREDMQRSMRSAVATAHQDIDRQVDQAFLGVEARVDDYLDWYFSLTGEYSRLGTVAVGKVTGKTLEALLQEQLQATMFAPEPVDAMVRAIPQQVFHHSSLAMQYAASNLQGRLVQNARQAPCALGAIQVPVLTQLDFARDAQRAALSLGAGGVAAVAGQRVYRMARALSSRIASGSIVRKLIGKRGGSALGSAGTATALCAPGGPLALACGAVVGGVTWFTVDKAMIAYDEYRYREEMKAQILGLLDQQKSDLKMQIKRAHDAALMQMAEQMRQNIDQAFIPARDGI